VNAIMDDPRAPIIVNEPLTRLEVEKQKGKHFIEILTMT
jgi:hypothetical protein